MCLGSTTLRISFMSRLKMYTVNSNATTAKSAASIFHMTFIASPPYQPSESSKSTSEGSTGSSWSTVVM